MMRALVASALTLATGIFAFVAAVGLTGGWVTAALIAMIAAGLVGLLVHSRTVLALDETACARGPAIVSGLATVAAFVQLLRLAVFMIHPAQGAYSVVPNSKWEVEHSCLSAYFVSAQAASSKPDVYDDALFTLPNDVPTKPRLARMIGPFKIDVFEYPPTFLLLPRTLRLLAPDFLHFRMLWFGLSGGVVLLGLLVVARLLGPTAGTRALLLSPLVWASVSTISTAQKGNAQGMVVAAAMLAMVLLERRRWAAGGALLAFVTMSKLYPGLLVVYLLARRQWRALGWTVAFAGVFLAASVLDTGWGPYVAFLRRLPGIVGGEAFPAFRNPAAIAINLSIPGLVFKLKLFGVPGMGFGAAKVVGWGYSLAAVAATALIGRRALSEAQKPLAWMAILILATLRSPFLPQTYAVFPALWLLTLLAATVAPGPRTLVGMVVTWVALNIYWPIDWPIDPRVLAIATLVPQAVTLALAVIVFRSRPPRDQSEDGRSALLR